MTKARTLADNYAADINQVSAGVGITGGGTSGTVTITNDMATSINAKGDLVVGTANDTYSRLAVASTAGYVLTVDSAEATGLKWAAAGGGLKKYTLLNTGGTALTGAQTITISGISNQQSLFIRINAASSANASSEIKVRFNTDSNNNYNSSGIRFNPNGPAITVYDDSPSNGVILGSLSSSAASQAFGALLAFGTNGDGIISFTSSGGATTGGGSDPYCFNFTGTYSGSAAITSVSIFSTTGNLDNGTVYVYGMAA